MHKNNKPTTKRNLKINAERLRPLTSTDLHGIQGGQKCDYSGLGSFVGSCNTCNLGL
jgi:hypothetical protein